MTAETDLTTIAEQERVLQFATLDYDKLWNLGVNLRALAQARGLALAIEIHLAGTTVFSTVMPGASASNTDWARRKRNVVETLHTSSYAVGLAAKVKGVSFEQETGRPARDFATHGGCFPLKLSGSVFVGSVTVSGAPQRIDHELVVEGLAGMLGIDYAGIALA